MVLNMEEYESLRDKFVEIARYHLKSADLTLLKDHYSCVINSNRTLSSIHNFAKLIKILEQRGVLRYDRIQPLKDISEMFIKDPRINRIISEYEKWLEGYVWPHPPLVNLYALPNGEYGFSNEWSRVSCDPTIKDSFNLCFNTVTPKLLTHVNGVAKIIRSSLTCENDLESLHGSSGDDSNFYRNRFSSRACPRSESNHQSSLPSNSDNNSLTYHICDRVVSGALSVYYRKDNDHSNCENAKTEMPDFTNANNLSSSSRFDRISNTVSNSMNNYALIPNDDSAFHGSTMPISARDPLIENYQEISRSPPLHRPQQLKPKNDELPFQNPVIESPSQQIEKNSAQTFHNVLKIVIRPVTILSCAAILLMVVGYTLWRNLVYFEATPSAPESPDPGIERGVNYNYTNTSYPGGQSRHQLSQSTSGTQLPHLIQPTHNSAYNQRHSTETFVRNIPTPSPNKEEIIQQKVFNRVSEQLGNSWRDMARFLDVREFAIDAIEAQNLGLKEKGFEALKIFASQSDPNYWQKNLKRALENARRKDLRELVEDLLCRRD